MWASVAALTLPLACQFARPPNVGEEDARMIDAPPACVADTIDCDDVLGVYTDCSSTGAVEVRIECPLGCAADEEKCLDIDPHNGLAVYLDMVENPPDVVLSGAATIDTMTGAILDDGVGIIVPSFAVPPANLRVFVVRSMTIDGSVVVAPRSSYTPSLAILATNDIMIRGLLDVSANGMLAGPGGRPSGSQDDLPCQSNDVFASPPSPSPGAGGGGGATPGGFGGQTNGMAGTPGGEADRTLEPLIGGCSGGSIYNTVSAGASAPSGGGGGAVQLASRTRIVISGSGAIDASGGGGAPGVSNIAGGGGGAGGKILLEAPQILLTGANVVVSTKGGGGAGASGTTAAMAGADGGRGAIPAAGGQSTIQAHGGVGGADGPPGPGFDAGGASGSAGGGGGAAGTTAAFTAVGAISPQSGAVVRGSLLNGTIPTRRIP